MKKVKTSQFCECLRAKQNALSLTWTQGSFVHYLALILSLFKNISHKSFTRNLHKIAAAMKITLKAQSIGSLRSILTHSEYISFNGVSNRLSFLKRL